MEKLREINPSDNFLNAYDKYKYIYIWLDILGFRNELEKGNEEIYNDLFDIRDKFFDKFQELKVYTKESFQISDGIVFVCETTINFKKLIEIISKLQMEFILEKKKLIRGAISLGTISKKLYENEKYEKRKSDIFLISNGLANAYKLESEYIIWPVIATTEEILNGIRKFNHSDKNELFGLKRMFGKGSILYFVDFLENISSEKRVKFEEFLENSIKEYKGQKRIFEKYYWLLKYYMKKMKQIEESLSNDYLISITGDEIYG